MKLPDELNQNQIKNSIKKSHTKIYLFNIPIMQEITLSIDETILKENQECNHTDIVNIDDREAITRKD